MKGCRFCLQNGLLADAPLFETHALYMLGQIPRDRRHGVMIIPKRHVEAPFELNAAEWSEMPDALQFAKEQLSALAPEGFTVGWNVGAVAGQTVAHAHCHVMARFKGDAADGTGLWGFTEGVGVKAPTTLR